MQPIQPESTTAADPVLFEVLTAAFGAAALALSARALLLLAIVGGFVLAMRTPTLLSLIELAIYGAVIVGPVAYLELRQR